VAANLVPASNKINADIAGLTTTTSTEAPAGDSAAGRAASSAASTLLGGDLGSILAGGLHPEAALAAADTSIVKPTDSLLGKLGGMIPRGHGTQAPGPAGAAANVRQTVARAPGRISAAVAALRSKRV
jgi:hypothetical protein